MRKAIAETAANRPLMKMLGSGLAGLFVKVSSALLSIAMFAAIARVTGPGEFGMFAFAFSLASLLAIAGSFGQRMFSLRMSAVYYGEKDTARLLGVCLFGLAAVAAGCALSAVLLYWTAAYFPRTEWAQHVWPIAILTAAIAFAEYLANYFRGFRGIFFSLAPRDIFWRLSVILVCAIGASAYYRFSASELLYVSAAALAALAMLQAAASSEVRGLVTARTRPAGAVAPWLRSSAGLWSTSLLHTFSGPVLPPVLLGLVLSPQEIGPFFAALRISLALDLFTVAMNMAVAPIVAKAAARKDTGALQGALERAVLTVVPLTAAVFLVIVWQGDWILGLMSPGFSGAWPVLVILSSGYLVSICAGPGSQVMSMAGLEWDMLRILSVTTAVFLTALFPAMAIGGAFGAAVVLALFRMTLSIQLSMRVRRHLGADPSILSLKRYFR